MYSLKYVRGDAVYTDQTENATLRAPRSLCLGLAAARPMPTAKASDIRRSMVCPVGGLPLLQLIRERKAKSACILASDATRLAPTAEFVPSLMETLQAGGIALRDVIFIVALGVHRDASQEEMRKILGDEYYGKVKIVNHTAFSPDNLIFLGDTSRGTPVRVNKTAYERDLHICVGKVEPHEFAGFSGGRKSVLPGICSAETIRINHSPEMLSRPECVPGNLSGNPIHEDMLEAAKMFRVDYCLSAVLNEKNLTAAVFGGDLEASHLAAVNFLRGYAETRVPRPDVVVTTPGPPLNIDFYQSVKALIALTDIADAGTTIAVYCDCPEGVQSEDMTRPFRETSSLEEAAEYAVKNYRIQMDHALLLCKILKKGVKIVVYSPHVSAKDVASMHMTPASGYDDMLAKALALTGKKSPKILFYPQPQRSLPVLV